MKAILSGLGSSLLVLLVFFLILEVVFRTTNLFGARLAWAQPDPLIVYRFTPGRTYWQSKENDHPVSGRINSLGWRDRERSLAKPPGVTRVCFLGDSMLAAFEVETDSTFVALAEDELNSRSGPAVEILNLGLPGATQTEELQVLVHDVEELSPDIVALYFNPGNDIGDVSRKTRGPMRGYFLVNEDGTLTFDDSFTQTRQFKVRSAINGLKQRSALVSLVAERYNLLTRARRLGAQAEEARGFPRHLRLCTAAGDSLYEENYALNKRLIREMVDWCRSRDVLFLLVCGSSVYEPDEIAGYREQDPSFDADFFERDLELFADELGVEYLGLQTPFRERAGDAGQPLHWGHLSYRGHRVAGEALVTKLESILGAERKREEAEQAAAE
jgi:hypothetical protein